MEKYIGTKIVEAEPAMRKAPTVHPLVDAGYEDGYKVVYADGYESWSPKAAFEEAYRPTTEMPLGLAIEAAKKGHKIARRGWNGKGQYVELATQIGYTNAKGQVINAEHIAIGNAALAFVGTSGVQIGWLASQADMLADDWEVVE